MTISKKYARKTVQIMNTMYSKVYRYMQFKKMNTMNSLLKFLVRNNF